MRCTRSDCAHSGGKGGDSFESLELIANLRRTIAEQKKEVEDLRQRIINMSSEQEEERSSLSRETARVIEQLALTKSEVTRLQGEVEAAKTKKGDAEKEQEDLLVLLEELSSKRKADKARMRAARIPVSEDEEDDDDDDEEEVGEPGADSAPPEEHD